MKSLLCGTNARARDQTGNWGAGRCTPAGVGLGGENLRASHCGRGLGLFGRSGLRCFLRRLGVCLLLLVDGTHLHAAFQNGAIFHADALRDHVTCQRTFTADVQTVCALNVALHFAQDQAFAGADPQASPEGLAGC
jgi:hypothetical protein